MVLYEMDVKNNEYNANFKKEFEMHKFENRLKTFQDWPFKENCACTPEKLAAAGFIYCGTAKEPDAVKCYVCLKELDGWEPEDDPWKEHVSHSGNCPFLKYDPIENTTVKEFLELEQSRAIKHAEQHFRNSNQVWSNYVLSTEEWLRQGETAGILIKPTD